MVRPPRLFAPVAAQSPRTQNSPKLFWNPTATGLCTVTSWPSRLAQKSMPNLSGWRVAFARETKLWLPGTDSQPSLPTSSAESFCVGGLRSTPRTRGATVLLDESTVMLLGELSSVANKLLRELALVDRNSATVPESEIRSPAETEFRTVVEDENTKRPFDTRVSSTASPCSQNPSSVYGERERALRAMASDWERTFAVTMPVRLVTFCPLSGDKYDEPWMSVMETAPTSCLSAVRASPAHSVLETMVKRTCRMARAEIRRAEQQGVVQQSQGLWVPQSPPHALCISMCGGGAGTRGDPQKR